MNYLRTLDKGCVFGPPFPQCPLSKHCYRSLVFVEANYEVREPNRDAERGSIDAQRTVFLKQGAIVLQVVVIPRPDAPP